jgi:hypothetical protein
MVNSAEDVDLKAGPLSAQGGNHVAAILEGVIGMKFRSWTALLGRRSVKSALLEKERHLAMTSDMVASSLDLLWVTNKS